MKQQPQQLNFMMTKVNGRHVGTMIYKGKEFKVKERDVFRVIPGLYKLAGITK